MDKRNKINGLSKTTDPRQLNQTQRRHWKSTYDLLRKRTDASEKEAREFAFKKVRIIDEIEVELAT